MRPQTWSATRTCAKKCRFGVFWLQTVHRSQPRRPNRWKNTLLEWYSRLAARRLWLVRRWRQNPRFILRVRSHHAQKLDPNLLVRRAWRRTRESTHREILKHIPFWRTCARRKRGSVIQEQCITRKNTYLSMYWCYWETIKLHAKLINRNVTHTKRCNNIFKRTRI